MSFFLLLVLLDLLQASEEVDRLALALSLLFLSLVVLDGAQQRHDLSLLACHVRLALGLEQVDRFARLLCREKIVNTPEYAIIYLRDR